MPVTFSHLEEVIDTQRAEIDRLTAEIKQLLEALSDRIAEKQELAESNTRLRAALEEIENWSRAYPLSVFPEPDLEKAAFVLRTAGMTLDAISASNMRHVVEGVGNIARKALANEQEK